MGHELAIRREYEQQPAVVVVGREHVGLRLGFDVAFAADPHRHVERAHPPLQDRFDRVVAVCELQPQHLLHTLAEFMRAREEIRREVKVLTAEGRMSAWVLGAMPVGLFFAVKTMSPGYLDPILRAPGVFALIGAAVSVAIGITMIMRMVRIDI